MNIAGSKTLYATDIRYLNDAMELKYTSDLLRTEISQRLESNNSTNRKLLEQLKDWLFHRLTNGHMLFVSSFTTNGNLLSQWRGYCQQGKGVSIGFLPENILTSSHDRDVEIEHVYLGPTPNNNSLNSLNNYLSKYKASPRKGNTYCQIPYRNL